MSSYKAMHREESPSKKVARLLWWHTARMLDPDTFYDPTSRHLVLAGPQTGDVSVLVGMGIPEERIIIVDKDVHCVGEATRRWPNAIVQHCELDGGNLMSGDYAWLPGEGCKLATVLLDFCGAPTKKAMSIINWIKVRMTEKSVLGSVFTVSRGTPEMKKYEADVVKKYKLGPNEHVRTRAYLVAEVMAPSPWRPVCGIHYKSDIPGMTGQPMLMLMFKKGAQTGPAPLTHVETDYRELADLTIEHDEPPIFDMAALLNVKRMTVAGWKAAATLKKQRA